MIFSVVILFHLPFFAGETHAAYNHQLCEFTGQAFGPNFRGIFSPSLLRSMVFLNLNLFPLGLILAAGGFYQLGKRSTRNFIFLSLWFGAPLLFYGNLHSTAPRFLIISIIPLLWTVGYMLAVMWESRTYPKISHRDLCAGGPEAGPLPPAGDEDGRVPQGQDPQHIHRSNFGISSRVSNFKFRI